MKVKQIKYVIFALMCMCVTPLITHAECDYQRKAELSRMASNVQFSYTYDENIDFTVNITNIIDDIYVSYFNPGTLSNKILNGVGEKSINIVSGTSLKFEIFSNDSGCKDDLLLTKYITVPFYNSFNSYDECQMYPNFKYCQLWLNTSITNEQFDNAFKQYISVIEKKKKVNKIDNSIINKIVTFFQENEYMIIYGLILIIIFVVSIVIIRFMRRK